MPIPVQVDVIVHGDASGLATSTIACVIWIIGAQRGRVTGQMIVHWMIAVADNLSAPWPPRADRPACDRRCRYPSAAFSSYEHETGGFWRCSFRH